MSTERAFDSDHALLALLVDSSADVLGLVDAEGVLVRDIPTAALGYPPGRLAGTRAFDLLHPEDLEAAASTLARVLDSPGVYIPFECRVRHADGSWRWYEIMAINRLDDPRVGGIVFNGREVTARRLTEDALRRSEHRWRVLLEHSSDVVTVLDEEGTVVFLSGNERTLGHPAVGMTMPEMLELVHPEDLERAAKRYMEALATPGLHREPPLRLRHADGSWRWIETVANNLLHDPDVRGIVLHSRDVTGLKEAEERAREESRFAETLARIGQVLAAELDPARLAERLVESAVDATGAECGVFVGHLPGHGATRVVAVGVGLAQNAAPTPDRAAVEEVLAEAEDGLCPPDKAGVIFGGDSVHSCLATAIRVPAVGLLGGLFLGHTHGDAFTDRHRRMASGIAAQAAVALDNARLYQAAQDEIAARKEIETELAHRATHDPLTGLPNRTLFLDRLGMALERLRRQGTAVAVLLLDFDRFKVVNDSLGHAAGDLLLIEMARRLGAVLRPGDTVARLGGDEFIMVCEGLNGEVDAIGIADRAAEVLSAPFEIEQAEISLTCSIGISLAARAGATPEALVRDADAAMYRAKEGGRNRWELFDVHLRRRAVERLSTETSLRRAIERGELRLHYQPFLSLADGRLAGVEALLRWDAPGRGLLPPAEFIPVAEETGMIAAIGRWVVHEACQQAIRWDHAGLDPFAVSVNVSARQLAQRDLGRAVQRALETTGLGPERLSLEITETVIMGDVATAVVTLKSLRDLGVQLWVDDFGTGYSSLAYLRRLPLDGLKIDRSFVAGLGREPEDSSIVAGVVSLARSLGLGALAEGVENGQQCEELRNLGCELAQGYLWAPALPPDELVSWAAGYAASR